MTVATVPALRSDLRQLARLYGVQTSYVDVSKRRREATPEALLAVIKALGAPVEREGDIAAAIRERETAVNSRLIEPVIVAWEGVMPPLDLPAGASLELTLDSGEPARMDAPGGRRLPFGYHRLAAEHRGRRAEALVICAPRRAYTGEPGEGGAWGTFLPLYALQSGDSWGSGDLSDLDGLVEWTADLGGRAVSTLPLLAGFLDEPFQPSPYSPASRLFWNEFYLDVTAAPEFAGCRRAQAIVESPDFKRELEELRQSPEVSYKRGMALKRRVLSALTEQCFEAPQRRDELRAWMRKRPDAEDYARFRAAVEKRGESWQSWPPAMRGGHIAESAYDDSARRYHLYVQFLAHEQLSALGEAAGERSVRLYFDLPLGVDPAGYDVWREQDAFVSGLSGGAPPDAFFTLGQNWGFPPPHSDNSRKQWYRYWRAVLGNILRYAGVLRIDHVPGLHRLYCVPKGMDARHGVYVRYAADELYAILSVESHRHKTLIAGEDLGTVPQYVHASMSRHGLHRTFVLQYALKPDDKAPLPEPRRLSVASLNTHDMPPFAAYWHGFDTDDRLDLGLMTEEQAAEQRATAARVRKALIMALRKRGFLGGNDADMREVLRALLVSLARSNARLALVNLEDLWLEERPQNVPGTTEERVNWRRKARCTLEAMQKSEDVTSVLKLVDEARRAEARR